jgi:uncharacterized protein (DUF3084 family)
MFLDPETIIKRISIVVGIILIAASASAAVWYNSNLKNEFDENYNETNSLREETNRLGTMTGELKSEIELKAKELKNNILSTKEETEKVDKEVKSIQQDSEKFKSETRLKEQEVKAQLDQSYKEQEKLRSDLKIEFEKLRSDLKIEFEKLHTNDSRLNKDLNLSSEKLQLEIDKLKDMNVALSAIIRQKDKEIEELSQKINKEIEWRNKSYWNR